MRHILLGLYVEPITANPEFLIKVINRGNNMIYFVMWLDLHALFSLSFVIARETWATVKRDCSKITRAQSPLF